MKSTARLVAAQPSQQQLVDYANALIVVNSYAYSITNQQLPVLNYPPENYAQFISFFTPAKQHALNWSSNLFVEMIQLPKTIVEQAANLFNMEELYIISYLKALIADPTNQTAKQGLTDALNIVQKIATDQKNTVDLIKYQLSTFSSDILNDAKVLTQIANDALADAGADQRLITNLNANIENLKSEIKTAQTVLTISEIGMGVSIFVASIGIACCFIPGAQGIGVGLIVVAVAGEATSIIGAVLESQNIKTMQKEINSERTQITRLKQDIIQLQGVSSQFDDLYTANLQAQNSLTTISTMWSNLDSVINDVITELNDVDNDVTSEQYQKALTDFKVAESNWNDVVAFAQALANINYSWQDTNGDWHMYGTSSGTQNPNIDNGNVQQIAA